MSEKKVEYRYKKGRARSIPAEVVAAEIEKIIELEGEAPPEMIVLHAAAKDHPLHDEFTWDDGECGRQWRIEEARDLAASYYAIVIESTGEETVVVGCISVRDEEGNRAYQKGIEVVSDIRVQANELRELIGVLTGIVRRYGQFSSCKPIVDVIKRLLRKQEAA